MKNLVTIFSAASVVTVAAAQTALNPAVKTAYAIADADVVVSSSIAKRLKNAYDWGTGAVRDLTNGIAKTTGRCPAVYTEDAMPATAPKAIIYLGDTEAARKAGMDPKSLKMLDFRIKSQKGVTFLQATTPTAASYGAGEYLRRFCDYWFMTVKGDDPAVFNPKVRAPVCDLTVSPKIYYRYLENGMYDGNRYPTTKRNWEEWNRHIRMEQAGIEPEHRLSWACGRDCHTSFLYCPPSKYFATHPEYYSKVPGGGRQHQPFGQLCYSNPEVKEIVYNAFVGFIEKDRAGKTAGDWPRIYDFSQEDNTSFICTCDECKKTIAKYTNCEKSDDPKAGTNGGDCGLVLEFVNDIARRVAKKYPDVYVRMFAYVSTETPPKNLKPEKNVLIWLCDLYSQCDHERALTCEFNRPRAELIEKWAKLAKRVEIWDYMLYGRDFPEPNVDAIVADAKFFDKVGIDRFFMESEYRDQPFYELNTFTIGEMYFNTQLTADFLLGKYCRVYGKGEKEMKAAIDFLRKEMAARPPKTMADWHGRVLPWLDEPTMAKFRALCEQGYAKETEGEARGRIAKVLASTCQKQMGVYRSMVGKDAALAEATEAYRKYAKENGRWTIMEEKWRAGAPANVDKWIERQNIWFDDLPDAFKGVSRADVKCLDRAYFEGEGHAKYVEDPKAAGGRALFEPFRGRMIPVGVYDRGTKASFQIPLKLGEGDLNTDNYEWRKLGLAHIDGNSIIWMPGNWNMSVYLKDFFVFCDGADRDLNWYEFWVSMRLQGPAFNASDADRPSGFMFDRVAMRRVDAPPKK